MVCETDHGLRPFLFPECRARRHTVIADEGSWIEVWVDLLRERLDLNLVIFDYFPGNGIVDGLLRPIVWLVRSSDELRIGYGTISLLLSVG
jgi:hypothetical protein